MLFNKNYSENKINAILFTAVVLAWSTSWIMIKFQIEKVPETMSVGYRFFGAALVLFIIAAKQNFPLNFSPKQHFLIFLQGINLFFLNHLFFYSAVGFISSGVVATSAALSVITIPIIDFLVHKNRFSPKIFIASGLGLIGVLFVASSEIEVGSFGLKTATGLALCLLGAISFSFGSIIGKELKLSNFKTLISSTAFSMLYGSILSLSVSRIFHPNFAFDFSFSYIFSLIYLILIPGIVGYCSILYLVEKIGSIKASYTALLYPVIALILSGIFENYHFTIFTLAGVILVILGNLKALRMRESSKAFPPSS